MKECIQCGTPMDEGEMFCPQCGTKQTESAIRDTGCEMRDGQGSGVRDQASEISDHDSRSEYPEVRSSPTPITDNPKPITESLFAPDTRHSPLATPSECEDLTIYFNTARVLMEDASFPFEFRVLPKHDGLDHLKITVSSQQGTRSAGSLRRSLKIGKERDLSVDVPIPAGRRGMLTFDIAVEYRKDGQLCRYECIWRSEVYPREAQCIQNLVIDIKQTQGHAGDIGNVNMSGIEQLAQNGNWREVLSELSKILPKWKELALEECGNFNSVCSFDCRGLLADPPSEAKQQKLTLETGGKKIHLISGDRIQLGRSREADLVTRIFDEVGNMPREENLYVSKAHCGLVRSGSSVKLQDGSLATGETKGKTWLNGTPVRGGQELPSGTGFVISFGQPAAMGRVFTLKGRLLLKRRSDGSSEPTGVLLERSDHVQECWLIVYDRVALKCLGSDWDGWCVARHKDGFCFGRETACKWLIPGSREFADARMVEVREFKQFGL